MAFAVTFLTAVVLAADVASAIGAEKPHIVMLLADDYGWGNLGVHRRGAEHDEAAQQARAEVHTPHLDALADVGILLDRHYSYSVCAPSRSALQTGRLSVHVNIENTAMEHWNPADPMSGSAGIPRNMTGLAQKMRSAGYRTHAVGKWGVGSATPHHTPWGRGYETWIGYFGHSNDYFRKTQPFMSTGDLDSCLNKFVDFSMHNATYRGGVRDAMSLSHECQADPEADPGCYEEHIFKEHALAVINDHNVTNLDAPLFLFYAFHLVHSPLEVPQAYLEMIDRLVAGAGGANFSSKNRRHYAAMTLYMDSVVGELVQALKAKMMWDNTLVIFLADNGGPIYEPGAANNHPLKGGKYSDWEGGVRTNAMVSGGFVPSESRGSTFPGVVSNADWYGTLCELAGVDMEDHAAKDANQWLVNQGLPWLRPVDSVAQWGFILNGSNGRSSPLHISKKALLHWPYKLIIGKQIYSAWQGHLYPNCSTVANYDAAKGPTFADVRIFDTTIEFADAETWAQDCGTGCLFNVETDPTEHIDLAHSPAHASTLADMQKELAARNENLFVPFRGNGTLDACFAFVDNGGYYGPFMETEDWYSPVPTPTFGQRARDSALKLLLKETHREFIRHGVPSLVKRALWAQDMLGHTFAMDKCVANTTAMGSGQPDIMLV